MKNLTIVLVTLVLGHSVLAHDEGHGPKLGDSGKYGGLVSAVVPKSESKKGPNATLIHKAELVRSTDGTARLYIYDQSMKPLDLKSFSPKAKATLGCKVKGKWKDVAFEMELKENSYSGKMPKSETKPYNIDVTITEGGKELLSAFDNLD